MASKDEKNLVPEAKDDIIKQSELPSLPPAGAPGKLDSKNAKQAGDSGPELGQAPDEPQKRAALVSPQSGQATLAEDPRGDSPRQIAPSGYVVHAEAGADHPNQPVEPTRYAFEMTQWLALPEAERANMPPPAPPEGFDPHPLAVQPELKEDAGKDLGRKQVILK